MSGSETSYDPNAKSDRVFMKPPHERDNHSKSVALDLFRKDYKIPSNQRRLRILLSVCALAYENNRTPLTDDIEWDKMALEVDLSIDTGNPKMDKWFKANFSPDTGLWIRNHPDKCDLKRIYNLFKKPDGTCHQVKW